MEPAAAPAAADLQHIYGRGSLLTRFCSHGAVMHTPSAVSAFLIELRGVVGIFLKTTVDYQPLNELAAFVDAAVEASQYQKRGEGK